MLPLEKAARGAARSTTMRQLAFKRMVEQGVSNIKTQMASGKPILVAIADTANRFTESSEVEQTLLIALACHNPETYKQTCKAFRAAEMPINMFVFQYFFNTINKELYQYEKSTK